MLIPTLSTGTVLLAEPYMLDANFRRTTVLICDYAPEGSFGLILNRPTDTPINQVLEDFPDIDTTVCLGGPVQTDTIFYLHNNMLIENSLRLSEGIFLGGNFDQIRVFINTGLITASDIRFFAGYAGWEKNQLEEEVSEGSWFMAEMHPNYLFKTDPSTLWRQIMEHKGDAYSVIAQIPDTADWN